MPLQTEQKWCVVMTELLFPLLSDGAKDCVIGHMPGQRASGVAASRDSATRPIVPSPRRVAPATIGRYHHRDFCARHHQPWRQLTGATVRVTSVRHGMHLHNIGTGQLPLAGAIICCTSIAPEQRVRLSTPRKSSHLTIHRHSSPPSVRRWARPLSSISPRTSPT